MNSLDTARRQLQEGFLFLKNMNRDLIQDIINFRDKRGFGNAIFTQNLTVNQCIYVLEQVRDKALTEENYQNILVAPSKESIDGVAANITIQIRHHKEVRNLFNYYIAENWF